MDSIYYNITFEINCKIIDVNIHLHYIFFAVQYTDNWKSRYVADYFWAYYFTAIFILVISSNYI